MYITIKEAMEQHKDNKSLYLFLEYASGLYTEVDTYGLKNIEKIIDPIDELEYFGINKRAYFADMITMADDEYLANEVDDKLFRGGNMYTVTYIDNKNNVHTQFVKADNRVDAKNLFIFEFFCRYGEQKYKILSVGEVINLPEGDIDIWK